MKRPDRSLVSWLFERQRFGIKPGLERIGEVLNRLGRPQDAFAVVLVTGTNGKGSTASALAACLAAAGLRVGLFTSPHLCRVMERFQVCGHELALSELEDVLDHIKRVSAGLDPTFFEIVTAACCALFARERVEIGVFEVGMGGRYDATNVLDPSLSVVTNVGFDHTEVLGDTLEAIAHDKAGIMRPGVPALTAATGVALRVIEDRATVQDVPLVVLGKEASYRAELLGWKGQSVTTYGEYGDITAVSPLVGGHQSRNLALAMLSAQSLGIASEAVEIGIREHRWPARLERVPYRDRWVVLDGAHNPSAAAALVAAWGVLEEHPPTLVLGLAKDKDILGVLDAFSSFMPRVIATRAKTSPRSLEPALIATYLETVHVEEDPREALEVAIRTSERGEHVLVTGSLFLVAELRAYVLNQRCEELERWQ